MTNANVKTMLNLYSHGYSTVDMAALITAAILYNRGELEKYEDLSPDMMNPPEELGELFREVFYHSYHELPSEYVLIEAVVKVSAKEQLLELIKSSYSYYSICGLSALKDNPIRLFNVRNLTNNPTSASYTFEYESVEGSWSVRERPSRAIVAIDGTNISLIKVKGVDPTLYQAASMVIAALSRSADIHRYQRAGRIHPYKIGLYTGYSGCQDYFLNLYKKEGNKKYIRYKTAAKLHVSMADKVTINNMYCGDAIELLLAAICNRENIDYRDIDLVYNRNSKMLRSNGVHFVRPYKDEIISEDELDFIPHRD